MQSYCSEVKNKNKEAEMGNIPLKFTVSKGLQQKLMRKNPFWLVLFLVSTDYVAENKIIYANKKKKKEINPSFIYPLTGFING